MTPSAQAGAGPQMYPVEAGRRDRASAARPCPVCWKPTIKLANRVKPHLNGKPKAPPSPPNGYGAPPTPSADPKKEKADSRDAKTGRFGKGNTAALGHVNPTARARAELQKALIAAVSTDDIAAVAKRLLADALRGQVASAELLLKYVVSKPAKAEDPDRVALEAWRLIQSWPWLSEFLVTVARAVNPALASTFAHPMVGDTPDKLVKKMKEAEEQEDDWGNLYIEKQTSALIQRRVTKGK